MSQAIRIVVLDAGTIDLPDAVWDKLRGLGELVLHRFTDHRDASLIAGRIAEATVVLTNKVPLGSDLIGSAPLLRFIGTLGTGYNQIDIGAASARGVIVSNVPGYSADFTAQHAVALILAWANRVGEHATAVRAGAWIGKEGFWFRNSPLILLAGLRAGIVGFGAIGRNVARVLHSLGMEIQVHSRTAPRFRDDEPYRSVPLDHLLATSDVVSLHCPLGPATERMINRDKLALMKPGALLVNTARGGLIDEVALAEGLRAGHPAAAALDVVSREPMEPDNPLREAPNCWITPHMGWASDRTLLRLVEAVTANVAAFLRGEPINVIAR